jgi:hypothetical protein
MKIFKITVFEPETDELKRYILPILQIRFQPMTRFRFRFLTADDGLPGFSGCKKIQESGAEKNISH